MLSMSRARVTVPEWQESEITVSLTPLGSPVNSSRSSSSTMALSLMSYGHMTSSYVGSSPLTSGIWDPCEEFVNTSTSPELDPARRSFNPPRMLALVAWESVMTFTSDGGKSKWSVSNEAHC